MSWETVVGRLNPLTRQQSKPFEQEQKVSTFKKLAAGFPLLGVAALIVAAMIVSAVPTESVSANHGSSLHNALRKKDVTNYGSFASIEGTNPDLHGGQWSYNRVAVIQTNPWRYGEIGWWKKSNGTFKGLIVWENPGYNLLEFSYSSGSVHSFSNQYDPNSGRYHWYYDGDWIHSDTLSFATADRVTCGGEVATGVEGMGETRCGNGSNDGLLYQVQDGNGNWVYQIWNGHDSHVEDAPYSIVNINSNNFRATGNE